MWIAATSFVLVLGGLLLLAFALRAKRVGSEPHCRRCEYNLTGAISRTESAAAIAPASPARAAPAAGFSTSALCPECGTAISRRTVKWGEKRRRVVMPIAGILLIAAGVPGSLGKINQDHLIHSCPFPLALILAKHGHKEALAELARRNHNGLLGAHHITSLVDTALEIQGAEVEYPNLAEWLSLLRHLDYRRSLTATQRDLYCNQIIHGAEFLLRDRYRVGEPVVGRLNLQTRWGGGHDGGCGWDVPLDLDPLIGGCLELQPVGCLDEGFNQLSFSVTSYTPRHIQGQFDFGVYLHISEESCEGCVRSCGRDLGRVVDLCFLSDDEIEPPIIRTTEYFRQALQQSIIAQAYYSDHLHTSEPTVGWVFTLQKEVPISMAAEVTLLNEGSELQTGTLYGWKGDRLLVAETRWVRISELQSGQVELILRFSPGVVNKTVDLEEVFGGEVHLNDNISEWYDRFSVPPPSAKTHGRSDGGI